MTLNDFLIKAKEEMPEGWIIAALTDEYIVDRWPLASDVLVGKDSKVLEIRVFGRKGELKTGRSDIGKDFSFREIYDEGEKKDERDHYDEIQYLDIDDKVGVDDEGKVTATGGGKYKLPLAVIKDAKIRIRYYLGKYEETGQAKIEDWRVVELMEGN